MSRYREIDRFTPEGEILTMEARSITEREYRRLSAQTLRLDGQLPGVVMYGEFVDETGVPCERGCLFFEVPGESGEVRYVTVIRQKGQRKLWGVMEYKPEQAPGSYRSFFVQKEVQT